ncbi:MAG TPA: helix-turn-helix transcriptional regulator [Actinomycetota bacterium]|nr:helix-turn-helix transcriptional regulator [Actinomycetota bacterium]
MTLRERPVVIDDFAVNDRVIRGDAAIRLLREVREGNSAPSPQQSQRSFLALGRLYTSGRPVLEPSPARNRASPLSWAPNRRTPVLRRAGATTNEEERPAASSSTADPVEAAPEPAPELASTPAEPAPEAASTPAEPPPEPTGFGAPLRRAREERGLSLEEAAKRSGLPVRFIQALERDNLTFLPERRVRVLLGLYARSLGADPLQTIRSFDRRAAAAAPPAGRRLLQEPPPPEQSTAASPDARKRGPILVTLVAAAAGAALTAAIASALLWTGHGGPSPPRSAASPGARPAGAGSQVAGDSSAVHPLNVTRATAFDPFGDGQENSGAAGLAADQNPGTVWTTEHYAVALSAIPKPGVGLVFDLGGSKCVHALRLRSPTPGFAFRVARGASRAHPAAIKSTGTIVMDKHWLSTPIPAERSRFWTLWITRLPSGGRASIAEATFLGSKTCTPT